VKLPNAQPGVVERENIVDYIKGIMIKEHERVVLTAPVPAEGLEAGGCRHRSAPIYGLAANSKPS